MIPARPPRIRLAHLPTPLEPLDRIRHNLWIKRDDLTGSGLSGNKVRKLEYLVADARAKGCDTLVTAGDIQSNHARATALVAAQVGMKSVLVLDGDSGCDDAKEFQASDPEWQFGNAYLDRMVGAEIDWVPGNTNLSSRIEQVCDRLQRQGRQPYSIPVGGSNALGTWGYIDAAEEMMVQCEDLGVSVDRVIVVSGSCGTHVGMVLGTRLLGWDVQITGIGISSTQAKKLAWADHLMRSAIQQYGFEFERRESDLQVHDFAGLGYAKSRPEERAVIIDVARRSGLLLDPVYTGKAFYGMLELEKQGIINSDETVLFIHSGGLPGLLAKSATFDPDEMRVSL